MAHWLKKAKFKINKKFESNDQNIYYLEKIVRTEGQTKKGNKVEAKCSSWWDFNLIFHCSF